MSGNRSFEKREKDHESSSTEKIEKIDTVEDLSAQQLELSGIEATAASKAAWLISMVVSLGGLLFGKYSRVVSS